MNTAHKIDCDLAEDCSCDEEYGDVECTVVTDVARTEVGSLAELEARLRLLSGEEFASLVHRITMRAGRAPKGVLTVVHWGTRADVNVLLPTVTDPEEAADILSEMKASADLSVDDLFRTKGDA
jgi:hypothetical protein